MSEKEYIEKLEADLHRVEVALDRTRIDLVNLMLDFELPESAATGDTPGKQKHSGWFGFFSHKS